MKWPILNPHRGLNRLVRELWAPIRAEGLCPTVVLWS